MNKAKKLQIDTKRLSCLINIIKMNYKFIYNSYIDLSWKLIPENAYSLEDYLRYIFYSVLLDYMTDSNRLYIETKKLFEKRNWLFIPKVVASVDMEYLEKILRKYTSIRYPKQASFYWLKMSNHINRRYNGVFEEIIHRPWKKLSDLESRIIKIPGFGQKKTGLLLKILFKRGILDQEYIFELSIPIDRHDLNILFYTGVINKKKLSSKEIKILQEFIREYAIKNNISPIIIDDILWLIGANRNKRNNFNQSLFHKMCLEVT